MSDQKEFDQEITPFHEHAIAFGVIALFGAMYLFFMQGCQPLNAMFGSADVGRSGADAKLAAMSAAPAMGAAAIAANASQDQDDDDTTEPDEANEQALPIVSGQGAPAVALAQSPVTNTMQAVPRPQSVDQARLAQIKAEQAEAAALLATRKAELEEARRSKAALEAQLAAARRAEQEARDRVSQSVAGGQQAALNQPQQSPPVQPITPQVQPTSEGRVLMLPDGRGVQIDGKGFEGQLWRAAIQNTATTETFDRINFVSGSDELNPESMDQILAVAAILNTYRDMRIKLRGHTDNQGKDESNLPLSLNRSLSVRKQLVDLGIGANRIAVEGMGASEPIADNGTEAGRAKNRRIDLTIVR